MTKGSLTVGALAGVVIVGVTFKSSAGIDAMVWGGARDVGESRKFIKKVRS